MMWDDELHTTEIKWRLFWTEWGISIGKCSRYVSVHEAFHNSEYLQVIGDDFF